MSGPEEVERLVGIIADGVRRKMMRPKCLARESWLLDSDHQLLRRADEERKEYDVARRHYKWDLLAFGESNHLTVEARLATADEVWDQAAFWGMLTDPRRLARRFR